MKPIGILFFVTVFVSSTYTQGIPANAKGFPQAGTEGTILVKGTLRADPGWQITGGTAMAWPKAGGAVTQIPLTVKPQKGTQAGEWEAVVSGLPSGQEYNLVVFVNVQSERATVRLGTAPSLVKVK